MQPVFMFEQFYENWEYTDCTEKFNDRENQTFKKELTDKLENYNTANRGSVDLILIDDSLR